MSVFTVNGKQVSVEENKKLITYLRDDLELTSVKNGCSQGACGTCMVLMDGKASKACILQTGKLDGKAIITVEGLSEREKEVYSYAFAKAGAVQCGFCIPGMVISAKGLLDKIPDPTLDQVKEAIKNNICRCTGYKKIEKAILGAARMFRDNISVPKEESNGTVGENLLRVDANAKVLGIAEYTDDIHLPGMLYGSSVRSKYPRAVIKSIDSSKAKALPGVAAVLTAEDIPGNQKIGHLKKDWDVLIPVGKITHYLGDSIVLIAAESMEILQQAKDLVEIEYEELEPIVDPLEAMKEGSQQVHESSGNILSQEHLVRGNAEEKIKNSKFVVTNHYKTPPTEHAFLEPETAVALLEEDNVMRIYSGDQGVYQTQKECAEMLGLPLEKVHVTAKTVGGGFGGKEDMSVQQLAALLAWHTKKPIKLSLTRDESILVHPKRHAMDMIFTTACDENGYLTAMKAMLVSDTGAYASLGGPVLQRACTHAAGPYNYQDIDIMGSAVYTNNPPAGAFRGFGVTQSCFATECNLNQLAEMVGISPWEIRFRNAIRPGQVLPNGQIADESTALVETLLAVKEEYELNPKCGIACAIKNAGLGVGIPDTGRCILRVKDGKVHIGTSAACIGQGMGTVATQMVCETTGISPQLVVHDPADTFLTPNSGNTTASRQTLFTGEASLRAAQLLKEALHDHTLEELNGQEFYGEFSGVTDKMGSEKENPVSHVAYSYATHLVELNESGRLEKVIAVHDVGRAVNPKSVEGQIEGGVTMSLGYSLTEDYPLDHGKPLAKFGTLGLFKSTMVPQISAVIVEKKVDGFARGAKGIGEIASIPTPPAVQLAYYHFDGKFRTTLPLEDTPYNKRKIVK